MLPKKENCGELRKRYIKRKKFQKINKMRMHTREEEEELKD